MITETPNGVFRLMSLDEFVGVFSEPLHSKNERGHHSLSNLGMVRPGSLFYCGLESNAEAETLLRHGWHDGVKRLLSLKSKVELSPARDLRRRRRRGDDGDTLDVDRALAGDWDQAWWQARRVNCAGTPTIDLVGAFGGNSDAGADQMFWSGATAVVLVDALESAGYSVRLLAADLAANAGDRDFGVFVMLKDSYEPLRPDVVASVMCHGGIYRTHGFRAALTLPTKVDSGMGSVRGWTSDVGRAALSSGILSDGAVILNHTYSLESCRSQIVQVIEQLQGGA